MGLYCRSYNRMGEIKLDVQKMTQDLVEKQRKFELEQNQNKAIEQAKIPPQLAKAREIINPAAKNWELSGDDETFLQQYMLDFIEELDKYE
jgi:membrane-bound lytic murein transglycosylase MltF